MYDDFDEYGDWDAMSCADGDYNTWEENEVYRDLEMETELDEDAFPQFCPHCGEPITEEF